MAASTCFYHPDQVASGVCAQCAVPLCPACTETVANKSVCRRCVSAIRARVAGQINPTTAAPGTVPATGFAPPTAGPVPPSAAIVGQTSGVGLLKGTLFGAIAGLVGAFVLAKIEGLAHFEWGYLNALVGFGVGYGVLMGDKRGGPVAATVGAVLAFFSMMFCEYWLLSDGLARLAAERSIIAPPIDTALFFDYLRHLDPIDWICIAIGVYGGAKLPLRVGRQSAVRM